MSKQRLHILLLGLIILVIIALYYIYHYTEIDLSGAWRRWIWYLSAFEFTKNSVGILLYIPFIYASLIFWWRGLLVVWLISIAIMSPHIVCYSKSLSSLFSNLLILLLPLMLVLFISLEKKWREKERNTLVAIAAERQAYLNKILNAQEDERQRIAQELHDDAIQSLVVIANRVQSIVVHKNISNDKELLKIVESIRNNILSLSEDIRRLTLDLRPAVLDDIGLMPAIRWLVDNFKQETNIEVNLAIKGHNNTLSSKSDVLIFRIVQEALNNIRWHSGATRVILSFEFTNQTINFTIWDNGRGFSPDIMKNIALANKFGLIGIRQRVKLLNGELKLSSSPEKVTLLSIITRPYNIDIDKNIFE